MFDSLQPHGLQHARPPCPSTTPRVYSNSCPLSWWYHPTISSFVILFSSRLQSFPASGSLPVSQFFPSGGLSIGSFSFSISPSNEYSGLISFRMDWLDLLAVQGTLKSLLQQFKSINSLALTFLYSPTLTSIHDYWKTKALTRWTFAVGLEINSLRQISRSLGTGESLREGWCLRVKGRQWTPSWGVWVEETPSSALACPRRPQSYTFGLFFFSWV